MLKQNWRIVSRLQRVADGLIVLGAFFFAYYFRGDLHLVEDLQTLLGGGQTDRPTPIPLTELGPLEDYLVLLIIGLPLYSFFLSILGGYRSMRFTSFWSLLRLSTIASGLVFVGAGALLFALKWDLSRSFVGLFCLTAALGLVLERYAVLALLRYFRVRGLNYRNVLVVGVGRQARQLYLEMATQPELGVKVRGFVDISGGEGESCIYDLPQRVIADQDSFESALKRYAIDEVLFTDVVQFFPIIHHLAEIAVEEGVRVSLAADLFSLEILKSDMSYFGRVPLLHYEPTPGDGAGLLVKRTLDIVVSSLGLVLVSPLLLLAAIAIKLDSPGAVFFRQKRVGLNGRTFTLLKFRSMVAGADRLLEDLKCFNEMTGPVFKMKNDPRITRVGRILRRYSIDELPQLINVLRGDMSLVGPRPPLPDEVDMYLRHHRRRLSMRPGITCTWQVSGRNEIPDFETWAKLDLDYIDNWSLGNDMKLLLRTIPAVFTGSGAR